ncbi:nicotinamide riboside transporter PnuC [Chitinophagaceae bacterium MMS25-I14]
MNALSVHNVAFQLGAYPVSYIELVGTLFGLLSIWYASRANILTWSTGIVNEVALFILFFQVQLYADMMLQVYFFIVTIYGWYNWKQHPGAKAITTLSAKQRLLLVLATILGTVLLGDFFSHIHELLPQWFAKAASFPYTDSLVMMASILATVLLARKNIENWVLWILADVICTVLYFYKGIYALSAEYFVFLCLASYGLYEWHKERKYG